ncbi:MAG: hypothetical protein HFJ20_00840 [Clostridia bacterium]|nr:hypothetical protein [Clostridia bacterium]
MQTIFGVQINTSTMTVEELEEARTKIQEILSHIVTGYRACHIYLNKYFLNDLNEDVSKLKTILANIEHQIQYRKISEHRFSR